MFHPLHVFHFISLTSLMRLPSGSASGRKNSLRRFTSVHIGLRGRGLGTHTGSTCFILMILRPSGGGMKITANYTSPYKLHTSGANWTEAVHICSHENTHLAIINSVKESEELRALMESFLNRGNFAFLGFHDREEEGKYQTIFGLPLSFTGFEKWAIGYPIGTTLYNCGCMHRSGRLCDHICNANIPFICEEFSNTGHYR